MKALPHHLRRHAKPGRDLFRAKTAFVRELLERLELVGGMQVSPGDVLVEADFVGVVRGIDDAADRLRLPDLLPLDAQKLRQPPALTDRHKIEPGGQPSASSSGSTTRFCKMLFAAMLAA